MSELSFLLELLLDHELPKPTKDRLAARIREVEARLPFSITPGLAKFQESANQLVSKQLQQAPSTLALMAKHGDIEVTPPPEMPPVPEPVTHIAQTPATAAAMNSRNEAIAQSIAGKIDKVTGRPKKW